MRAPVTGNPRGSVEASLWLESYAQLSTTTPNAQKIAELLGYYDVGDAGQGLFVWDPTSVAVHNGGTVVQPVAHQGPGRWLRLWDRTTLQVGWFGAKGDGVTDDAAAIQATLNAAVGTQGSTATLAHFARPTVRIPSAQYRIGSTITPGPAVEIIGEQSIFKIDPGVTALSPFGYMGWITGITFAGGAVAIGVANGNVDTICYWVNQCEFLDQTTASIHLDGSSSSTCMFVSQCKFYNLQSSAYLLWAEAGDLIKISDSWVTAGTDFVFRVGAAVLHLDRMFGVPAVGAQTWVLVEAGSLLADGCRFGGENGGNKIVDWRTPAGTTTLPSSLVVTNCYCYAAAQPAFHLRTVPNQLKLTGNSGFPDSLGVLFDDAIPDSERERIGWLALGDVVGNVPNLPRTTQGAALPVVSRYQLPDLGRGSLLGIADRVVSIPLDSGGFDPSASASFFTPSHTTDEYGNFRWRATATADDASMFSQFLTGLAGISPGPYTAVFDLECDAPWLAQLVVLGHAVAVPLAAGRHILAVPFVAEHATPAVWTPSTPYLVGDYVLATSGSSFFRCSVAGISAGAGPGPTASFANGLTVTDGTVTWQWITERILGVANYGVSNGAVLQVGLLRAFAGIHTDIRSVNTVAYGASFPGAGTWQHGDLVYDTAPAAAGTIGWVCTAGGSPGTWKAWGTIAA